MLFRSRTSGVRGAPPPPQDLSPLRGTLGPPTKTSRVLLQRVSTQSQTRLKRLSSNKSLFLVTHWPELSPLSASPRQVNKTEGSPEAWSRRTLSLGSKADARNDSDAWLLAPRPNESWGGWTVGYQEPLERRQVCVPSAGCRTVSKLWREEGAGYGSFPSQPEGKIGLPRANPRGRLRSPS